MRWHWKREIFPLSIIALLIILSFYFYPRLPEIIPSHFDLHGKPDKFAPKTNTVILMPALMVGLYPLLTFIPLIDPFWRKIQKKYTLLLLFRDFILLFFLFFYILVLIAAKRGSLPPQALGLGLGFLFILLGNYLPKLPRNFFFGLRSPWTLASEVVWRKTHILGGWLFVAGGVLMVLLSFSKIGLPVIIFTILVVIVIFATIVYPLLLYKKLQRREETKVPDL